MLAPARLTCCDCGEEFPRQSKRGFPPKRCPQCKVIRNREVAREHYYRTVSTPEGRAEHNRKCAERMRVWLSAPENRERFNAYHREYQARRLQIPGEREKKRAKENAYNAAHPDRNSRIGKSWRERNPDKVAAYELLRKQRRAEKLAKPFNPGAF